MGPKWVQAQTAAMVRSLTPLHRHRHCWKEGNPRSNLRLVPGPGLPDPQLLACRLPALPNPMSG
eukprot:1122463-Alexandrium_andersonii.AAC.1